MLIEKMNYDPIRWFTVNVDNLIFIILLPIIDCLLMTNDSLLMIHC